MNINKKLDKILQNQQVIYDYLHMIIYNQCPKRKATFIVKEDSLKTIQRKYNIK